MQFFVMAKTLVKNLFSKPATVKFPFEPRQFPEGSRGQVLIDTSTCIFCGLCQRKCPTSAITVIRAEKKWSIKRMQCISCGACVDGCPKDSLKLDTKYTTPDTKKQEDTYNA
ncbi:MAG: NADH-quinone oxidoreductase subunit 9 [Bacteroidetes bacterium ADurb.Bin408]|nr:4Fe-4S dicluster domain-containing protein [Fibrobacter sp.]OPZ95310.1 MAG: NADH-quinone oxidoreductase subunit 9 [Bacteroidetes bacterium ADurb.Bin408]